MKDTPAEHNCSRRNVLKTLGSASMIIPATTGIVIGNDGGHDLQSAGIYLEKYLKSGRIEEAKQVLSEAGVPHSSQTTIKKPTNGTTNSNNLSTDAAYNKDKSEFTLLYAVKNSSEDIYSVSLNWSLGEGNLAVDKPGPNDVAGISYAADRWAFEPDSSSGSDRVSNIQPSADGVTAKYDDPGLPFKKNDDRQLQTVTNNPVQNETDGSINGYLKSDLEKQESGQHNVYGHYVHTYNPFGAPSWIQSISISFGSLSVSVSPGGDKWEAQAPVVEF